MSNYQPNQKLSLWSSDTWWFDNRRCNLIWPGKKSWLENKASGIYLYIAHVNIRWSFTKTWHIDRSINIQRLLRGQKMPCIVCTGQVRAMPTLEGIQPRKRVLLLAFFRQIPHLPVKPASSQIRERCGAGRFSTPVWHAKRVWLL